MIDSTCATAAACVDALVELERAKAAICAQQARLVARLAELRPAASERSLGQQVGLARRESPSRGRRYAALGVGLVVDHPGVLALLEAGEINERRAELLVTETADLPTDVRRVADREIAGRVADHPTWGDRDLTEEARRVVFRLDPDGATRRRDRAQARRHVTARSHGDGTGTVSGLVADHHLAAIVQSLHRRAEVPRASGCDDRSRAQIVADLFVERLTGQATAASVPVAIELVVPATSLLVDGDEPAHLPGVGPVPAPVARALVAASPAEATTVRRLFTDTDRLVAMESVARAFTGLLRRFVVRRDRHCRTPWCDAPIVHVDHVVAAAEGGPTSSWNAQGLCESCNLVKEEAGWAHRVTTADVVEAHEVETLAPTGHRHRTRAPDPPGTAPRDRFVERRPGVYSLVA